MCYCGFLALVVCWRFCALGDWLSGLLPWLAVVGFERFPFFGLCIGCGVVVGGLSSRHFIYGGISGSCCGVAFGRSLRMSGRCSSRLGVMLCFLWWSWSLSTRSGVLFLSSRACFWVALVFACICG